METRSDAVQINTPPEIKEFIEAIQLSLSPREMVEEPVTAVTSLMPTLSDAIKRLKLFEAGNLDIRDILLHLEDLNIEGVETTLTLNERQNKKVEYLRSKFTELALKPQNAESELEDALHFAETVLTYHWPLNQKDTESSQYIDPITLCEIPPEHCVAAGGYLCDVERIWQEYNTYAHIGEGDYNKTRVGEKTLIEAVHFFRNVARAEIADQNSIRNHMAVAKFSLRDTIDIIKKGLDAGYLFLNIEQNILDFGGAYFYNLIKRINQDKIENPAPSEEIIPEPMDWVPTGPIPSTPIPEPLEPIDLEPIIRPIPIVPMPRLNRRSLFIRPLEHNSPFRTIRERAHYGLFEESETNFGPIAIAIRDNDMVEVNRLISSRLVATTFQGNTLLHLAVRSGHREMVELLTRWHANVNARDINGNTPLHLAIELHQNDLLQILLAANPKPVLAIKNNRDLNVFDCARMFAPRNDNTVLDILNHYAREERTMRRM